MSNFSMPTYDGSEDGSYTSDEDSEYGVGAPFHDRDVIDEDDDREEEESGMRTPPPAVMREKTVSVASAIQELTETTRATNDLLARMALREDMQTPVSFKEDSKSGTRTREVVFTLEDNLLGMSQKGNVRVVPRGNLSEIFGADTVSVLKMDITHVSNRFPVSLALAADHLPGEKIKTASCVNNSLVMLNSIRKSDLDLSKQPRTVYKSTETAFAAEHHAKYPNFSDKESLCKNLVHLRDDFSKSEPEQTMVKLGHPILEKIKLARAKNNLEPPSETHMPGYVVVSTKEAIRAINCVTEELESSTETTPVSSIHFTASRSNLSQSTLETAKSALTDTWTDPSELGSSIKGNQTFENELKRICTFTVTANITFRPCPKE